MLVFLSLALAADVQADLHIDTPTQLYRRGVNLDDPGLESGIPQMRAGSTNLAVMVLWPPRDASWEVHTERLLSIIEQQDARFAEVEVARTPAQARTIIDQGHIAMLIALEGAHGIDTTGVAGLQKLYERGLRMMSLTWSFSNRYAGSSGDSGGGITDAGRALVAEANRLGVVLDVSHASRQATLEICQLSSDPVVASHSDAYALSAQARNLSDEAIRCIASKGGVIGVNLHSTFLGRPADVKKVADHFDYLRKIGGVDCVALGSDFDGLITPPADVATAGKLGAVWAELRQRGWTEEEIRKARGENFMRVWETVSAG